MRHVPVVAGTREPHVPLTIVSSEGGRIPIPSLFAHQFIRPIVLAWKGEFVLFVAIESPLGRVERSVRTMEGQVEEERTGGVAPVEPLSCLGDDPIRRVQFFRLIPRTRNHRITFEAIIDVILCGTRAFLLTQPRQVVVVHPRIALAVTRVVKIAIVQNDIIKTNATALWPVVHLADCLSLVPGIAKRPGKCNRHIESNSVLIADPAVRGWGGSGHESHPRRNTGGARRIGLRHLRSSPS